MRAWKRNAYHWRSKPCWIVRYATISLTDVVLEEIHLMYLMWIVSFLKSILTGLARWLSVEGCLHELHCPSSIFQAHTEQEKADSQKLCPDFHICSLVCVWWQGHICIWNHVCVETIFGTECPTLYLSVLLPWDRISYWAWSYTQSENPSTDTLLCSCNSARVYRCMWPLPFLWGC